MEGNDKMFDNRKVANLIGLIADFLKSHSDIYLMFEETSVDIFPLLHRLKANVKAILVDANVQTPQKFFNVPVLNFQAAVQYFNPQTAIIRVVKKNSEPPIKELTLQNDTTKKILPLLEISADEIKGVYSGLILRNTLKELEADGIKDTTAKNVVIGALRGFSTFTNIDSYMKIMYTATPPQLLKFDIDDVGIVIQGPLMHENNYTITTAQMYRKFYPNIPVVISTWKNEADGDFRKACKANSIVLLENTPPQDRGYLNVNLQLESSFQGVNYIKNHTDAQFVLKTRSDQRIYRPDFLLYFKNLIKVFPVNGNKLVGRLLAFGIPHSILFIPFHLSDHLHFGFTSDMLKLYSIPQINSSASLKYPMMNCPRAKHDYKWKKWRNYFRQFNLNSYSSLEENRKLYNWNLLINKFVNPEIYIFRTFYEKYIQKIDSAKLLETYWKFLHDYIVIADGSNILIDWSKYEKSELSYCIWHNMFLTDLDYAAWLNLYNNFNIDWI